MSFSDFALISRWILPLWALGWLVLPLSSRLLGFLPDLGLAAGRVVALVLLSALAFWGAATHLVPLSLAPVAFVFVPPGIAFGIASGWRNADWRTRLKGNWRRLMLSDAVFLLAFGAFLWVRLRHPEANDFEKPMDMALLAAAQRADFLPFQNPWFAGTSFTNYYYFGPLMGALLARTFATAPHLAYNLVQPLFCAGFLSVTWSLGAALAKSAKIGLLVMLLVCVGGHLEPLRQIQETHAAWTFHPWDLASVVRALDYWKTSRVIENTINEYPAFTLLIGDLHAHFYALALAMTHFCLCFGLLKATSERQKSGLLLIGGVFLGVFAITNTWDTPLYGLLWLGCALWSRRTGIWTPQNTRALVAALLLVPVVTRPYFGRFESQVSGVVFDFWVPPLFSLALLWGGWWMLGFLAMAFDRAETQLSPEAHFRRFLLFFGLLALLFPFCVYLRGYFGDGDLRHQDTVFKFGLQAWLLGGLGIAAELGFRGFNWWRHSAMPFRAAAGVTVTAFFGFLSLAPANVAWTRATRDAPRDASAGFILSLDAARFVPPADFASIEWLRRNAKPGETVVEAPGHDNNGGLGGDYDGNCGRVATFSGVPDAVGWPQHVWMWGTPMDEVQKRGALVGSIYRPPYDLSSLPDLGATYLFFGAQERLIAPDAQAIIQARDPRFQAVEPQILRVGP